MTRVISGVAAAVLLVGVSACAGSGEPAEPSPPPTTPASTVPQIDCNDASLLQAPTEALDAFPDNPGVDWTARPASGSLGELVLVSMTPVPDEVGYPEFQFVYRCDVEGPSRIATYALDGETFVLLATTSAHAGEELPPALP